MKRTPSSYHIDYAQPDTQYPLYMLFFFLLLSILTTHKPSNRPKTLRFLGFSGGEGVGVFFFKARKGRALGATKVHIGME